MGRRRTAAHAELPCHQPARIGAELLITEDDKIFLGKNENLLFPKLTLSEVSNRAK